MRVVYVTYFLAGSAYLLAYVGYLARAVGPVLEVVTRGASVVAGAILVWYFARAVRWSRQTQPDIFGRSARCTASVTDREDQ